MPIHVFLSPSAAVNTAKTGLGERGAAWWTDGAPDFNRRMAKNTPYADWWAALEANPDEAAPD